MSRDRNLMKPLLPPDYRPTEREPFMNPMQLEYFRQKLLRWRAELWGWGGRPLLRRDLRRGRRGSLRGRVLHSPRPAGCMHL